MTTPDLQILREELRERLRRDASRVLEMLEGSVPLEPAALLNTLHAVGLLDEVTVGVAELRARRRALIEASETSSTLERALSQLDLDAPGLELSGHPEQEQAARLERLIELAALAQHAHPEARDRLEAALMWVEGGWAAHPTAVAHLAPLAGAWADALDLDPEHRVTRLLECLEDTRLAAAPPLDDASLRRGLAAAASNLREPALGAWLRKLSGTSLGRRLAERQLPASPAFCSGEARREDIIPDRVLILSDAAEELAICACDGSLFLEWDGEAELCPDRVTLEPEGVALAAEVDLFAPGTALWFLGWPPAGPVERLVLHRATGAREVPLDG